MADIVATVVAGIEFDALIEDSEEYSATTPNYPVDSGYSVTDNIAMDPIKLKLTLYVTATPVTFLSSHGSGRQRVESICDRLIAVFEKRELVNVTTPRKSYSNMAISSISIRTTAQAGYAREIPIEFTQVTVTSAKTVTVPEEYARSGTSMEASGNATTTTVGDTSTTASERQNGNTSQKSQSSSSAGSTMLYSLASGLGNKTGWYSLD